MLVLYEYLEDGILSMVVLEIDFPSSTFIKERELILLEKCQSYD